MTVFQFQQSTEQIRTSLFMQLESTTITLHNFKRSLLLSRTFIRCLLSPNLTNSFQRRQRAMNPVLYQYKHPDHGVVLLGDFNDFDIRNLTSNQNLKQVVKQPTRGSTILDLIVTNLDKIYSSPTIIAPLGSSDHSIIQWFPLSERPVNDVKPVKHFVRRYILDQDSILSVDGLLHTIGSVNLVLTYQSIVLQNPSVTK